MLNYINSYFLYPILEKVQKRKIINKYREMLEWDKLSQEAKNQDIKNRIFRILKVSQVEVPYYKDIFQERNFKPEKILVDLKYLEELPVLTKDIILEQGLRMFRHGTNSNLHPRKTGGSTGKSVVFYYDDEALDWSAAAHLYSVSLTGKRRHHSEIHLSGEIDQGIKHPLKLLAIDFFKLASLNRSKLMVSGFSEDKLQEYYSLLLKKGSYLVQGHPSTMYAIANYVKEKKLPIVQVCAVFEPSGEALNDKIVSTIEKYLKCKVFNRYGNAELGVVAHNLIGDDYTKLKVFERLAYIETTKEKEIFITGLYNFSMPLIRYNTGDMGHIVHSSNGDYLTNIEGRIHDRVEIQGEIYPTHFIMDYLDHRIGGVTEFQIILNKNKKPLLRIVPQNMADSERIKNLILNRWPMGLDIEFIAYGDLLQVGWRNKFKHLIVNN